jgi:hypothetical protein
MGGAVLRRAVHRRVVSDRSDVGAGCIIADLGETGTERGTKCASLDYDRDCPDPEIALPPVQPHRPQTPTDSGDGPESPIVLDIGPDGYHFTSVTSGVRFDVANSGTPVQMGWTRIGTENAFLAFDRNGNGRIDSGAELFGNFTPLKGGGLAPNGFIALAELDGNRDGIVDPSDAGWATLLLWTDRNHDGMSTPGELQPIGESIVAALETDHRLTGRRDQWGNEYRYASRFHLRSGEAERQRAYYDVFFVTELRPQARTRTASPLHRNATMRV